MTITGKDIETLKEVFTTKDEFKEKINRVTTSLDWLMGKMETVLNELKIISSQMRGYDDKFENHEKRIKVLESNASV